MVAVLDNFLARVFVKLLYLAFCFSFCLCIFSCLFRFWVLASDLFGFVVLIVLMLDCWFFAALGLRLVVWFGLIGFVV